MGGNGVGPDNGPHQAEQLNNKLAHVLGVVSNSETQPTQQSYMVYEDLATRANGELKKLDGLLTTDLAAFNKLLHDANVPAVEPPKVGAGGQ